jgi:hypothetical protein
VNLERRTRVELFLPIRGDSLQYKTVTEWLAEELAYIRGGSTLTTRFTGFYLSPMVGIVRDRVQILFCDFSLDLENENHYPELAIYLDGLRLFLSEVLNEEEVWITCQPGMRAAWT